MLCMESQREEEERSQEKETLLYYYSERLENGMVQMLDAFSVIYTSKRVQRYPILRCFVWNHGEKKKDHRRRRRCYVTTLRDSKMVWYKCLTPFR